jgi:ABC-type glycerol-3-phosphate transport system substrate-binding protein
LVTFHFADRVYTGYYLLLIFRRKEMKGLKSLAVFVLVLGLAVSVFAGGKKESGGGSGVTTVKWAIWDYDLTVYYKPLIDAYQAKIPW